MLEELSVALGALNMPLLIHLRREGMVAVWCGEEGERARPGRGRGGSETYISMRLVETWPPSASPAFAAFVAAARMAASLRVSCTGSNGPTSFSLSFSTAGCLPAALADRARVRLTASGSS